jgi:hypothetical protein
MVKYNRDSGSRAVLVGERWPDRNRLHQRKHWLATSGQKCAHAVCTVQPLAADRRSRAQKAMQKLTLHLKSFSVDEISCSECVTAAVQALHGRIVIETIVDAIVSNVNDCDRLLRLITAINERATSDELSHAVRSRIQQLIGRLTLRMVATVDGLRAISSDDNLAAAAGTNMSASVDIAVSGSLATATVPSSLTTMPAGEPATARLLSASIRFVDTAALLECVLQHSRQESALTRQSAIRVLCTLVLAAPDVANQAFLRLLELVSTDSNSVCRALAVYAVGQVASEGRLARAAIDALLPRVADADVGVRKALFVVLARSFGSRALLTPAQRAELVTLGLAASEHEDARAAAAALVVSWARCERAGRLRAGDALAVMRSLGPLPDAARAMTLAARALLPHVDAPPVLTLPCEPLELLLVRVAVDELAARWHPHAPDRLAAELARVGVASAAVYSTQLASAVTLLDAFAFGTLLSIAPALIAALKPDSPGRERLRTALLGVCSSLTRAVDADVLTMALSCVRSLDSAHFTRTTSELISELCDEPTLPRYTRALQAARYMYECALPTAPRDACVDGLLRVALGALQLRNASEALKQLAVECAAHAARRQAAVVRVVLTPLTMLAATTDEADGVRCAAVRALADVCAHASASDGSGVCTDADAIDAPMPFVDDTAIAFLDDDGLWLSDRGAFAAAVSCESSALAQHAMAGERVAPLRTIALLLHDVRASVQTAAFDALIRWVVAEVLSSGHAVAVLLLAPYVRSVAVRDRDR